MPKLLMSDAHSLVNSLYELTIEYLINAYQSYHFAKEYVSFPGGSKSLGEDDVQRCLNTIMKHKKGFVEELMNKRERFMEIEARLNKGENTAAGTMEELKLYMQNAISMQTELAEMIANNTNHFRASWLQFDPFSAYASFIFLAITTFVAFMTIICIYALEATYREKEPKLRFLSWHQIALIICILLALAISVSSLVIVPIVSGVLLYLAWKYANSILFALEIKLRFSQETGHVLIFVAFTIMRIYTFFSDSLIYNEGILYSFTILYRKTSTLSQSYPHFTSLFPNPRCFNPWVYSFPRMLHGLVLYNPNI